MSILVDDGRRQLDDKVRGKIRGVICLLESIGVIDAAKLKEKEVVPNLEEVAN